MGDSNESPAKSKAQTIEEKRKRLERLRELKRARDALSVGESDGGDSSAPANEEERREQAKQALEDMKERRRRSGRQVSSYGSQRETLEDRRRRIEEECRRELEREALAELGPESGSSSANTADSPADERLQRAREEVRKRREEAKLRRANSKGEKNNRDESESDSSTYDGDASDEEVRGKLQNTSIGKKAETKSNVDKEKRHDRTKKTLEDVKRAANTEIPEPLDDTVDRRDLISWIYLTECNYVETVKLIVEMFVNPLMEACASGKPIIPRKRITEIFCNIEAINRVHLELVDNLGKALGTDASGDVQEPTDKTCVGKIFCDLVPYLKLYIDFTANFNKAVNAFEEVSVTPEFQDFIFSCFEKGLSRDFSIDKLLIRTIERVTEYEILLRELLRLTPKKHADYGHLETAACKFWEVKRFILRKKEESMQIAYYQDMINRIQGLKMKEVETPGRKFICEGRVVKKKDNVLSEWFLFLFSDVVIKCIRKDPDDPTCETLRDKGRIILPQCTVHFMDDSIEETAGGEYKKVYWFEIRNGVNGKKYMYGCIKKEDRDKWFEDVQNRILKLKSSGDGDDSDDEDLHLDGKSVFTVDPIAIKRIEPIASASTQSQKQDAMTFWQNLAADFYMNNMNIDALRAYRLCLRLDPTNVSFHLGRGMIYENSNHLEDAKECYEKVLSIDPDNTTATYANARLIEALGDEAGADKLRSK